MIRSAVVNDAVQLEEIYNQAIEQRFITARQVPLGLQNRKEWLSNRSKYHSVLVYEHESNVIGYAALDWYRRGRASLDRTAVISYFVDKDFQNQGIGTKLIDAILAKTRKEKFLKVLIAIIIEENEPSVLLLKKFNFQQWAYLPDVFNGYGKTLGQIYMGIKI